MKEFNKFKKELEQFKERKIVTITDEFATAATNIKKRIKETKENNQPLKTTIIRRKK